MPTYTVTNLNGSGSGSLYDGISYAISNPGTTIEFSVSGTITSTEYFPTINQQTIIDGTTAPLYSGIPIIIIDCSNNNGLNFAAGSDYSQIIGLSIINSLSNGIYMEHTSHIAIDKNYIGLDGNGNKAGNKLNGIFLNSASYNLVGINPTNSSSYVSNVISGNGNDGIAINGASNIIVSNHIGTNVDGTIAIGNGQSGISINYVSASNNIIGGTEYVNSDNIQNNPSGDNGHSTPVFIIPPLGNLISGNNMHGININNGYTNTINGNFIGTNYNGTSAIGNLLNGIYISNYSNGNIISGCSSNQHPYIYYNIISGNGLNGIYILDSTNTTIQSNYIGIGSQDNTIVPNTNGIFICGSSTLINIGYNGLYGPLGNVISGNIKNGIYVTDMALQMLLYGNIIGIYGNALKASNGENGIYIDSSLGQHIINTCTIAGNNKNGIMLAKNSNNISITTSYIGNVKQEPMSNGNNGILLTDNSSFNIINGNITHNSSKNKTIISSNKYYGIKMNKYTNHNSIYNCYIGLNKDGLSPNKNLGNGKGGIKICDSAYANSIGHTNIKSSINGSILSVSNYISDNNGHGIYLTNKAKWNSIFNNVIGYDANGTKLKNKKKQILNKSKRRNEIYNNDVAK